MNNQQSLGTSHSRISRAPHAGLKVATAVLAFAATSAHAYITVGLHGTF